MFVLTVSCRHVVPSHGDGGRYKAMNFPSSNLLHGSWSIETLKKERMVSIERASLLGLSFGSTNAHGVSLRAAGWQDPD